MLKRRLAVLWIMVMLTGGCRGDTTPASDTAQARRGVQLDLAGLGEMCPCHPDDPDGTGGCDWSDYIPSDVSTRPSCVAWIGQQEVLLCGAFYHFNKATTLSQVSGVDWPKRLAYFRAAVENLMDLLFDTQDLVRDDESWLQEYIEERFDLECTPQDFHFPNEDRVKQLVYLRRLKLQAVELYRRIAEYYPYALVAEADGSRAVAGNTAAYSDGVWSPFDDGTMGFLDLQGYRGMAAAFLLGADVKVLDELVARSAASAGVPGTDAIQLGCGKNDLVAPAFKRLFDLEECNERMLVPLSPCQESSRNAHMEAGLRLLRQFGVPIDSYGSHVTDGADLAEFLISRVNQDRQASNFPPVSDTAELLDAFGTNLESLEQGSRYLEQEGQLYLYNLGEVEDPTLGGSYDTYLQGYGGRKIDIQRTLVTGRVNGSRVGHEDIDVEQGEFPLYKRTIQGINETNGHYIFNYFKHSYFKTLSFLKSILQHRVGDSTIWWRGETDLLGFGTEINEPFEQIVKLAEDEVGEREIFYTILFLNESGGGPWDQFLTRDYGVFVELPFEVSDLEFVSGRKKGLVATSGGLDDGLDGLRCRFYGQVGGQACDLDDYRIDYIDYTNSGYCDYQSCSFLDFRTNQRRPIDSSRRYPLFVFIDGELVDSIRFEYGKTWRDWEPHPWASFHYLRTQIDLPVKERIERIIKRSDNQCSEPFYNSLGLRNDLVPPLKNELISSGGGNYEDSYQYYLQKARDSAVYAGTKIKAANDSEEAGINYSNEIDEVQAKTLNRLEQICGEGRSSCTVPKDDYGLGAPPAGLWAVPAMEPADEAGDFQCDGYSQNPYLPNYLAWPEPPTVDSPGDFLHLGRWIRCHNVKWFSSFAETFKIRDLPEIIANDPYLSGGSIYTYDGEYLTALIEINSGLLDFLSNIHKLFFLQDTVGLEMAALQDQARALAKKKNAAEMKQSFALFKGIASIITGFSKKGLPGAVSAGADMQSSYTMAQIEEEEAALNLDSTLKSGFLKALVRLEEIKTLYTTMRQNKLRIETGIQGLKKLELEQSQVENDAERLEEAKLENLLGTECVDSDGQCLKDYRTLFNIKHLRALDALRRAQKMSFIAKRALEFKLGVDFTREKQDGIIVDSPTLWQDDVFRVFSDDPLYDGEVATTDYVKKLEDYLYGYPFDHPFADEEDVAIISVRDDLLGVSNERMCLIPQENGNYVLDSHDLEVWERLDSDTIVEPDTGEAPDPSYGQTADRVTSPHPMFYLGSRESAFYGEDLGGFPGGQSDVHGSIWVKAVGATVRISVGFRATYYQEGTSQEVSHVQVNSPNEIVFFSDGWVPLAVTGVVAAPAAGQYVTISLSVRGTQTAFLWGGQITATTDSQPYMPNPDFEVRQGCQLYQWNDPISGDPMSGYYPSPQLLAETMRRRFRIKCVDDAVALPSDDLTVCGQSEDLEYFETDFTITLTGIMEGKILRQDQFAIGNYNYRLQELGVNLVGSNVKDCSLDPGAGSACYQNQFIPYDFTHGGHVQIMDYEGKTNYFTMSTGVIHYGKALAAERILTNPMSSTDTALLEPYKKSEFRGRPIQGNYTLRVYNIPGLRWINVEDVQIYMKYRYWSAFSNP